MPDRRFPPPWSVDEATESFCIRDAKGQRSPMFIGRRMCRLHPLTRDGAWRIAVNIARLPELLQRVG